MADDILDEIDTDFAAEEFDSETLQLFADLGI